MECILFFRQETAYEVMTRLGGAEMCIRDRVDLETGTPYEKEVQFFAKKGGQEQKISGE